MSSQRSWETIQSLKLPRPSALALGVCGIIFKVTAEEIAAAALKLGRKERAKLASELIRSLEEEGEKLPPEECEKLWLELKIALERYPRKSTCVPGGGSYGRRS